MWNSFKGIFSKSLCLENSVCTAKGVTEIPTWYSLEEEATGCCSDSCSWKVVAAWKGNAATAVGGSGFLLFPLQDMESPAKKRLRTAVKSSILTQPEGKSVGSTKKKVTFDSNLAQCDKEGSSKTIQPATKGMSLKETADIVVKYLTPFYKGGKFASKVGHSSRSSSEEGDFISLGIWGSKKGEMSWIPPFISKLRFAMCSFSDSLSHRRVGVGSTLTCDCSYFHIKPWHVFNSPPVE